MKLPNKFFVLYLLVSFFSCQEASLQLERPSIDPPIIILPENRLPQIHIQTNGVELIDELKVDVHMTITENDVVDYDGTIGIEIVGTTSQKFPKKQFEFETRNAMNEALPFSLLGFPEEKEWILYAPYSDKSLIRNVLMYDLSRDIGRYASRAKFVEVTINDTYNGVYVLLEKLKRDKNRININKLKADVKSGDDLTGGYILKIDKADGVDKMLYTPYNSFPSAYDPIPATDGQKINFLYDTPNKEDITAEQRVYISNYIASFESALAGDNFTDPLTGYAAYIDTQSFIDFFLLNELSNNIYGFRLSTWLIKDKSEKLKMGPIWDFSLAFGNVDYCIGSDTDIWTYKFNERCSGDFWLIPFWWERLIEDPKYVSELKSRWSELRNGPFSNAAILQKVDSFTKTLNLSGGIQNNFERWPIMGEYIWPNDFVGNTYTEERDYLINWIKERLSWMDGAIGGL